jgi:hypothetical protein
MSQASGRQRLLAAALGICGVDRMTREELSAEIDRQKGQRQSPPNEAQLRVAAKWGLDISSAKTAGAATNRLWDAALAQVFVLSVMRKICGADWRFHEDCILPNVWINKTAIDLVKDAERAEIVREIDNAMSGTAGDAWFRFGKRQAESIAYRFVADAAQREFGSEISIAKTGNRNTRIASDGQSGCLVVLTVLVALSVFSAFID